MGIANYNKTIFSMGSFLYWTPVESILANSEDLDPLFGVLPIGCGVLCLPLFCCTLLCFLSSFVIIRELAVYRVTHQILGFLF